MQYTYLGPPRSPRSTSEYIIQVNTIALARILVLCIYIYIYTHMHIYIYIYMDIYIYIHTHIVRVYTHVCVLPKVGLDGDVVRQQHLRLIIPYPSIVYYIMSYDSIF